MIDYSAGSDTAKMVNEGGVYVAKEFKPLELPSENVEVHEDNFDRVDYNNTLSNKVNNGLSNNSNLNNASDESSDVNNKIETMIRTLANLHHVEVEKNAVPESLGLLEQYEVRTVEELDINTRWGKAAPNKSIKSLIGWRGKSDLVYWDLHERFHGPHALVGGTTGSGKSEFLTTYLIGLAINYSPEDIGMLIIDWKGGGIANTLDKLPHFMGAITNLDGAGTARALASIKAELDKRQREFAKYGVNNINGYMSLYKGRFEPKEGIVYPDKPLPHLVLVSDEFAELKANVPEFLDELTSVARIGRSLGVHLILATQKPSGVVNDQIEANSRSKIALKMASTADSNELLKTPDAASITNPGRGYLKVGENEVYEMFQSGYAGIPYDPDADITEVVDERIYSINDYGQYELLLDPSEDVKQGHDTSDLPTELEAVIDEVNKVFEKSEYVVPDKPWLPNLSSEIVSEPIDFKEEWKKERDLSIPLGELDIPEMQMQKPFDFDITKMGHTAIFASPGYGKSTLLQTLVMNLSRKNTAEQVNFNLLDFGTNGLLPLKDLPQVVDLVGLDEKDKLTKYLNRIHREVERRSNLFKEKGVATLSQYEDKTGEHLPVDITVIDGYDTVRDNEMEELVELLLNELIRSGASLGMYMVATGMKGNTFKINMISSIPTKIVLYMVDEGVVKEVLGRDALAVTEVVGRGQIKLEKPTSLQVYLPSGGETDIDRLHNLETDVEEMNKAYTGIRPKAVPMVPKKLLRDDFFSRKDVQKLLEEGKLPLGLDMESTDVISVDPKETDYFLIINDLPSQEIFVENTLSVDLYQLKDKYNRVVYDPDETFENSSNDFDISIDNTRIGDFINELYEKVESYNGERQNDDKEMIIFISDMSSFQENVLLQIDQFKKLIKKGKEQGILFIFQGEKGKLDGAFDDISKYLLKAPTCGLIGTRIYDQSYVRVKSSYSEAALNNDETHFFKGQFIQKTKLVINE